MKKFLGFALLLGTSGARAAVPACTQLAPPVSGSAALNGVAVNQSNGSVLVAGQTIAADGTIQALAAFLSNGAWTVTPLPSGGSQSILLGVRWLDPTRAMAAGSALQPVPGTSCQQDSDCPLFNSGSGYTTGICSPAGVCQDQVNYVLKWDGSNWTIVDTGRFAAPAWEGYPPSMGIGVVDPSHIWTSLGLERFSSGGPDGPWATQMAGIPADGGHDCLFALFGNSCDYQWAPYALAVHSANDIWGSGEGLLHWTGSSWSRTTLPSPDLTQPGCGKIVNNAVLLVNGSGYTSPPKVLISPPPHQDGDQATANALMGLNTFSVTNGGSGYTSAPTVTAPTPKNGFAPAIVATVAGGAVTSVSLALDQNGNAISPGGPYTKLPPVTISGGGGTGAAAAALDLQVIALGVTDAGSGYPGFTDSWADVTFTGGGGSGALGRAPGSCFNQGAVAISAVPDGKGGFVDYEGGTSEKVGPGLNGGITLQTYVITDRGGSWHVMEQKPQISEPVDVQASAFRTTSDGWIGGIYGTVGATFPPSARAYVEHFDGTSWSEVGGTLPSPGLVNWIDTQGTAAFAVGTTGPNFSQPMVLKCQ